jgi:hypothetical protein
MTSDFSLKNKTQLYLYKCIISNFKVNQNSSKLKILLNAALFFLFSLFFFPEIKKINCEVNKIRAAEQPAIKLYMAGSKE